MNNFKMSVPLAVALATLLAASAEAATLAYSPGDLFLGFRSSSSTTDFLINIGPAAAYRDAAPGTSFTLSIGNIKADLDAVFGTNWNSASRSDLFWGVAGSNAGTIVNTGLQSDGTQTLYATSAQNPFGTPGLQPTSPASQSTQASAAGRMQTLASGYTLAGDSANGVSPAANPAGLREDGNVAGSWRAFMGGGQTFTGNSFTGYFTDGIEGNFGGGEENTALDLWRVTKNPSGVASYEGTFTINSSGVVTYSVVHEPTSAAMLGFGAGLLGLARRRRPSATA